MQVRSLCFMRSMHEGIDQAGLFGPLWTLKWSMANLQGLRHDLKSKVSNLDSNYIRFGAFKRPVTNHESSNILLSVAFIKFLIQTEKAFLKQPKVFLCSKKAGKGKRPGKGGNRFWKSIGLGFKTPREAIEGGSVNVQFPGPVRYEKRHSNIAAHVSPCFRVKEGDHVIIGQCRPLAKTVRFNVLKVIPAGSKSGGGKKAFSAI
ncbi:putative 40S ribosomal protein S11 [Cocos nucifera]|uniref:Putative 40S ribosomal protein S11 n=1 Tax=Cocos nucifera TaxID=13894 RepID=A0A8K0HX71_COCNU|nr:putative 40S ribosomal protein S11 [Cocos nucifera]